MPSALIDANLLVLLVVGSASSTLIERHKRLRKFSTRDYDFLRYLISGYSPILVTPNTLTEASNLCRQFSGREYERIGQALRAFVDHEADERYVPSKTAVRNEKFLRLGLTDAVILEQMAERPVLITTDLDLFAAAIQRGHVAINFNHVRPV